MTSGSDASAAIEDAQYALIQSREKSADGSFVYGVRTTGIYCRPSCPSRLAKRENVEFFDEPEEAAKAGYRPCKRCKPDQADAQSNSLERMRKIAEFISRNAEQPLTLEVLADFAGMSPFHLQRTFKAAFGVSPKEYHAAQRLETFKQGLKAGESVLGAVFDAGYGSTSRAYEQVDGGLGMTPTAYRKGGEGESITYAEKETALGPLLMAATDRGVCFVQFGDSESALLDQLKAEFPKAELTPARTAGNDDLAIWMDALDAHLSKGFARPDLPLDLRGTAFQIRVWRFLLNTRAGEVVSYAELARGIGEPKAVRAAASACGANRVGVLVPCHRALRADGGLGGYRWGLERKRTLLDKERREKVQGARA